MELFKKIYIIFIRLSKILSRKGIYPFLNNEFNKIKQNSKVLTIGSGGEINNLLKECSIKNNYKVLSFDISQDMMPDILGDICEYDFKEEKFDYVVIAEVLEHLHSPHLAIDNINNILNKNGKIILTVPFIFPIHEAPYDYFRYTKYGLKFLFKDFKDVKIEERNNWLETINVLFVRLVMDKKIISRLFAPIFIIFAYINLPIIFLLSKIIKTDFITSGYLLSARKQ